MPQPLRIGVNALYLIPGGVGGTEIYLRNLLSALAAIDRRNLYYVFTNRETGRDLSPKAENFRTVGGIVPARVRPLRLLWGANGSSFAGAREGIGCRLLAGVYRALGVSGAEVDGDS